MRHVVWDWNGTLVDDAAVVLSAANEALTHAGGLPIDADGYRTHYSRPVHQFYERMLGRPIANDEWQAIDDRYHDHYESSLDRLELVPDAVAALERVASVGVSQSLLSMWRHDQLITQVDRFDLGRYFARVDGLRGPGGGPKTDHLREHVTALDLTGGDVVVIGDALDDAVAARDLGARCVLYDGGSDHRDELDRTGVPVAETLLDALEFVGL